MTGAGIENITRSGWLDDFELLEEIGRGGMGVVYRARWARNGRIVALKILPSLAHFEGAALERFQREAEAAGRIEHPGVVPIFAVGEHGGVNYFAMALVEGPSLHALIDSLRPGSASRLLGTIAEETALDEVYPQLRKARTGSTLLPGHRYARSCAEISALVADALTAAHAGGVIHRDIKPSNILLNQTGQPVLVDFGLASDDRMLGLTLSGEALGTPSYMAPEQACGESDLDARVDIYGLGATLYELLTLRPPFDGSHPAEIMRQIVEDDPAPVRRLNPRVPAKLEAIVHTCLAKEPDNRYESMLALANDLRAFLQGRPVRARRLHVGRRLQMFLRRHRSSALVGSAIFTACFSIFVLVGIISGQRTQEQGLAALEQAQQLQGDRAQEAYGRAVALLGAKRVLAARHSHLRETFPSLYAVGRFADLRRLLDAWPVLDRDDGWLAYSAQLDGRGRLLIAELDPEAGDRAFLRGISPGGRLQDWQLLKAERELPLGEYLVRLERVGKAIALHRVRIDRDQQTVLHGFAGAADLVDEGFALILGGVDDQPIQVQREEISSGDYADFLAALEDRQLQAELLPRGWDKPFPPKGRELPVSGLSYRQARIVAGLLGGHLMSDQEFALAGVGGLAGMPYPWGREFDPQMVVADPDRLTGPMPVDSAAPGASSAGIVNLVGNLAEILAPDGDGSGQLAGGHYLSRAAELRIDSRLPLGDPGEQHDLAGFRLARFLALETDEAVRTLAESKVVEMTSRLTRGSFADWTLSADGDLSLHETLLGEQDAAIARSAFDQAIEGFLPIGNPRRIHDEASPNKLVFESELQGRTGLFSRHGAFYMSLPLRGGEAGDGLTRLRLPGRVRVDRSDPPPSLAYVEDEDQILIWEQPGKPAGATLVANIRFRRDGLLTSRQPILAELEPLIRSFIAALNKGDVERLSKLLDREYQQTPQALGRIDLVDRRPSRMAPKEMLVDLEIVDVAAVGDIATAWLRTEWQVESRDGRALSIEGWNLSVQLRRTLQGYRVLSLGPHGRADEGKLVGNVYYGPKRLKVSLSPPPGVFVLRGHDGSSEVQVECLPGDQQAVSFSLHGDYTEPGGHQDMVLHHLTQGAISARPGRRLQGPKVAFLGSVEEGTLLQAGRVQDWLFGRPDGNSWSRERWIFIQLGRRWFWVRERAEGSSPGEAKERFRAAAESFQALEASLHIR